MKTKRHAALYELLQAGHISSQSEAVERLSELGFEVTQATVSRDLDEIGAVKIKEVGRDSRYSILDTASGYGASLSQVLKQFIVSQDVSGNMIVLRTPPGHANAVATALDRAHLEGILGTVAGDDTIFICVDEGIGALKILGVLQKIANVSPPDG